MTEEQALQLGRGDIVEHCGVPCRIQSVQLREIAAPLWRLDPVDPVPESLRIAIQGVNGGDLTSWRLCSLIK